MSALRIARETAGLTIDELANKTSIPAGTLWNWDSGRCSMRNVTPSRITALNQVLGATIDTNSANVTIGDVLADRDLTLTSVAADAGVPAGTLWNWTRGRTRPRDPRRLAAVAGALGVSTHTLVAA
jgi:transcriptional regulator with XRE-family HTH domain